MANNCNLIKSVYRIDSNGIVTGSSTVFLDILRVMFISLAGSMPNCWHRCQHGLRKMRESARNDISRTHANFARCCQFVMGWGYLIIITI